MDYLELRNKKNVNACRMRDAPHRYIGVLMKTTTLLLLDTLVVLDEEPLWTEASLLAGLTIRHRSAIGVEAGAWVGWAARLVFHAFWAIIL